MTTTFATLKKGSKGAAVAKLQERLKTLGYYSAAIDGDFGLRTEAAVIAFQKGNTAVDGIVDVNTQLAIMRIIWIIERPILMQGANGTEVKELQFLLQKYEHILLPQIGCNLKLNVGAIYGDFGAKTKAALITFQTDRNLVADGIVGVKTWEQLSRVVTFDADDDNLVRQHFFFSIDDVA
ncbi:MAG: peptidoglycan-binding protein [Cyanobacteria bacterium J06629_18]